MHCSHSRCCIALVIGIPGSGKTHFIHQLVHHMDAYDADVECQTRLRESDQQGGTPAGVGLHPMANILATHSGRRLWPYVISYDKLAPLDLQEQMSKTGSWKSFREDVIEAAKIFVRRATDGSLEKWEPLPSHSRHETIVQRIINDNLPIPGGVPSDILILVDDNLYYRSMRYEWFQIAREVGTGFCQLYIDCPLGIAKERNCTREGRVPDTVLEQMVSRIEKPYPSKYFWEKHSLVLPETVSHTTRNQALDLVCEALEDSLHPLENDGEELRERAREVCSKNMIHQVDQALRQIVSRQIKAATGGNCYKPLEQLPGRLAAGRKNVLSKVRAGRIHLPQELTEAVEHGHEDVRSRLALYLTSFLDAELQVSNTLL